MAKTANEKTEKMFEAMSGTANETLKKSYERSVELMGEMGELSKKNLEALTESTRIATKGMEEMSTHAAAFSRDSFDKSVEVAKSFSGVKSVQEALELQSQYSKSAFENYFEQMNKMTGLFASTCRQAAEPLNAQAGKFMSMMQKTA